ncbi:glycosyltransferase [Quadrisphaera sp. INWT6]|uniref:glycosyltransferase n=1 Tax=Quadrisphaera sp. INWT6 TaxID=2596917 RepID=UPI0018927E92|nr:glycosyltransferase [Quadrisphaera sp. INWT6]MBF5080322.1 glycosyltransferase [Quadrisphaera sp. INWT6]
MPDQSDLTDARAAPGVSVVMATYDGARHLREQLDSIAAQTLQPCELLVGDDGSTDDTLRVLEEFAATSAFPVHVVRNPTNLGFADNFLETARRARGRYIAFSDQDDVWLPRKVEESVAAIVAHDAVMATHQVVLVDVEGTPIRLDPQLITHDAVVEPGASEPFGLYFGFAMTIDARLLQLLPHAERGTDTYTATKVLPHDRWVYFLATNFGRSALIAHPLAHYRQHPTQSYGVRPVPFVQRYRNKVAEGSERLDFLSRTAAHRAELATRHAPSAPASVLDRGVWRAVVERYERVARLYALRSELHRAAGLPARARLLARLAAAGTYAPVTRGGLGRRRLAEDVVLGLLRASWL